MRSLFVFIIFAFFLVGCRTETVDTVGVVTEVDFKHIGRNKYKQLVTYAYTFENENYQAEESFWFRWQGSYANGDSIKVQIEKENPDNSEILGKLQKPQPVKVIKLN